MRLSPLLHQPLPSFGLQLLPFSSPDASLNVHVQKVRMEVNGFGVFVLDRTWGCLVFADIESGVVGVVTAFNGEDILAVMGLLSLRPLRRFASDELGIRFGKVMAVSEFTQVELSLVGVLFHLLDDQSALQPVHVNDPLAQ